MNTYGCLPPKIDVRDYKLEAHRAGVVQYPDEFKLTHPRVKDQQSTNSCHDDQTQVLTKDGWKFFKDITYDDKLASVNPEDGNLIFENPVNIIVEPYEGNMIVGKQQSMDFKVTPNHKMIVAPWIESKRKLSEKYVSVDADKLVWWQRLRTDFHQHRDSEDSITFLEEKITNGNILPEVTYTMSDWVKFLGIYLAEGTAYKNGKESHWKIQIAGVKDREKDFIRNLLVSMGLGTGECPDRFQVYNKRIWKQLEEYGLVGVKSYDKFVPDFIFDLDEKYIKDFLYGFAMGDGSFRKYGTVEYFTSSPALADQIERLILLSGSMPYKYLRMKAGENESYIKGRKIINKHDGYTVSQRVSNITIHKKRYISQEYYSGIVYCAEVPTYHTLITKRNGKILLSGNCVAHATSSILEYHSKGAPLSTQFIYGIRKKEGMSTSQGMYLTESLKLCQKYGDMLESDCAGNQEVPRCFEPAEKALEDSGKAETALNFKIDSYYRCETMYDIKCALTNYGPVLICVKWHDKYSLNADGVIDFDTTSEYGYHATMLYGWNKTGFLIQNSWSKLWSKEGCFTLPYEQFDLIVEARAVVDDPTVGDYRTLVKPKIASNNIAKLRNKILNAKNDGSTFKKLIKKK